MPKRCLAALVKAGLVGVGDVLGVHQAVLGRSLPPGSSFMDYLFRDPLARERIVNWAEFGGRHR